MPKLLRVDMSRLRVSEEPAPEDWRLLGGRALTSRSSREVEPGVEPLSPRSEARLRAGAARRHGHHDVGRTSFGGKSPLMGGLKESNVGGVLGHKLAKLGIKAVIIEGAPEDGELRVLRIAADGSWSFERAGDLAGSATTRRPRACSKARAARRAPSSASAPPASCAWRRRRSPSTTRRAGRRGMPRAAAWAR